MSDTSGAVRERPPRYEIKEGTDVTVTLAKRDETSEAFNAVLADLSAAGARFKTDRLLSVKDALTIEINVALARQKLTVCGEICWVAPAPGDAWWLGCRLKPPIPRTALDEFAQANILERREDPRQPVELESLARWELNADSANAEILNYSRGGFCMRQCTETMLGERVLLEVRPDDDQLVLVRGKALWQIESSDGYVIGCEFVCREDYLAFNELKNMPCVDWQSPLPVWRRIKPKQSEQPVSHDSCPSKRRRAFGIAAAFAIVLACVAIVNGSWPLSAFLNTHRTGTFDATAAHSSAALSQPAAQERHGPLPPIAPELDPASLGPLPPIAPESDPASLVTSTTDVAGQETPPLSETRTLGSWLETVPPSSPEFHAPGVDMMRRQDLPYDIAPKADVSTPDVLTRSKSTYRPNLNPAAEAPPEMSHADPDMVLEAFQKSRDEFLRGEYETAAMTLQSAIWHDTTNAEYRYFLAIIRFNQDRLEAAKRNVQKGVELERERPIEAWGKTMERFQGRARLWLEKQRRELRNP